MEVFELSFELEGNLSDDEISQAVRDVSLRLNALFHLRGGHGFRLASIDTDSKMGIEILQKKSYGILDETKIILRLIPIETEGIMSIIEDFRIELETTGFKYELDDDDDFGRGIF